MYRRALFSYVRVCVTYFANRTMLYIVTPHSAEVDMSL